MRVGIICEGPSDAAVITNILKATLEIDRSDIQYLVPELDYDETDLTQMPKERFSTWSIVKQSCEDRQKINNFLELIDDDRFIVIHLDSDTRNEKGFDVFEPKNIACDEDIELLCTNITSKIYEWLGQIASPKFVLAIAVAAIDAWVLSIYDSKPKDTGLLNNPKVKLFQLINRNLSIKDKNKIFALEKDKFEQYHLLSTDFRKLKNLKKHLEHNISLKLFCEALLSRN
jgi:hypothetical protein